MKKFLIYIIFVFFFINNCLLSQLNYFPVHIGDYHNYSSGLKKQWSLYNNYVFDTVNMNTNKYFLITDGTLDTVRVDENKNIIYRMYNKDNIRYKMDAKIGETWVDESGYTTRTYCLGSINDAVSVKAGTFKGCYKFYYDYPKERYDWLAPGIGLVKGTGYYDLYNYNINNNFKPSILLANEKREINANIDTTDYFPMKVGNYYCYYEGVYQKIMYFMDTINLEGKKYHLLLNGYIDTVRIDDDGNVFYKARRLEENYIPGDQLYFKLNGTVGDSWLSYYYNELSWFYIYGRNELVETPVGYFSNCLMVGIQPIREYWLASGIGIVVDASQWNNKRLYNARINGIRYPGPVSVNQKIEIPALYKLFQNYPNPFNPTTVISIQLAVNSQIVIKIYDILGREVKTIVDERKPAGMHEVIFNSKDISSGVYMYSLKIKPENNGKEILLRKMMTILK